VILCALTVSWYSSFSFQLLLLSTVHEISTFRHHNHFVTNQLGPITTHSNYCRILIIAFQRRLLLKPVAVEQASFLSRLAERHHYEYTALPELGPGNWGSRKLFTDCRQRYLRTASTVVRASHRFYGSFNVKPLSAPAMPRPTDVKQRGSRWQENRYECTMDQDSDG